MNNIYLRNRKHFPCFYRVIETRVEVWEKREIAWEHEHKVRVFPRNFEFLPNFHKCFYKLYRNTEKNVFYFLYFLNSLLKTIKKINLLILITFIQILNNYILIYVRVKNKKHSQVHKYCPFKTTDST